VLCARRSRCLRRTCPPRCRAYAFSSPLCCCPYCRAYVFSSPSRCVAAPSSVDRRGSCRGSCCTATEVGAPNKPASLQLDAARPTPEESCDSTCKSNCALPAPRLSRYAEPLACPLPCASTPRSRAETSRAEYVHASDLSVACSPKFHCQSPRESIFCASQQKVRRALPGPSPPTSQGARFPPGCPAAPSPNRKRNRAMRDFSAPTGAGRLQP
jgi:hypothetical protein